MSRKKLTYCPDLENISQPTWLCCVLLETVTAITTDLAEATLGFAVTQSSYA
ncbi:hypothetical protein AYX14_03164, partial [Cryptococcus neoformans]